MFFFQKKQILNNLQESRLFDETSFYAGFTKDLLRSKQEVMIESPFISQARMEKLLPIFQKLLLRGVKISITTRDPADHSEDFRYFATEEILKCSELGVNVILAKGNHHRKLAIIDSTILWEGSLNILSQSYSKEVMRRIEGETAVKEMFLFLKLQNII